MRRLFARCWRAGQQFYAWQADQQRVVESPRRSSETALVKAFATKRRYGIASAAGGPA
jgi:hypothetical protein